MSINGEVLLRERRGRHDWEGALRRIARGAERRTEVGELVRFCARNGVGEGRGKVAEISRCLRRFRFLRFSRVEVVSVIGVAEKVDVVVTVVDLWYGALACVLCVLRCRSEINLLYDLRLFRWRFIRHGRVHCVDAAESGCVLM